MTQSLRLRLAYWPLHGSLCPSRYGNSKSIFNLILSATNVRFHSSWNQSTIRQHPSSLLQSSRSRIGCRTKALGCDCHRSTYPWRVLRQSVLKLLPCQYWAFAFVIASAIPNLAAMATLVGAFCILQWANFRLFQILQLLIISFSQIHLHFPPYSVLWISYADSCVRSWSQVATWNGSFLEPNRLVEGSFSMEARFQKAVVVSHIRTFVMSSDILLVTSLRSFKTLLIVIFLGACAFWALGSWAGIEALITTFASGSSVAFSCRVSLTSIRSLSLSHPEILWLCF